jgi:hypothetical protein
MRYAPLLGVLAVVCSTVPVGAEVFVSTPWVTVHVGRPLPPLAAIPVDPPDVPLPPTQGVALRAPTLEEFAASFHPAPGSYEVVVLHPVTCRPVKVCFTLPPDCVCKVKVHRKLLVFEYGHSDRVAVRFHHDGSVTVRD